MKKNLNNAMARQFRNMVTTQLDSDSDVMESQVFNDSNSLSPQPGDQVQNIENDSSVAPVISTIETKHVLSPIQEVVEDQTPVGQSSHSKVISAPEASTPTVSAEYDTPIVSPKSTDYGTFDDNETDTDPEETVIPRKRPGRKPRKTVIPLVPEERSSGVLHIRLGEMRSYVDFMIQSNKISYQQYISSLIEADYEQHKEIYQKYREFMEQFHM